MSPLLLLAALSTSSANTGVFAGIWKLDEATSDYIPSPDAPTVAQAARGEDPNGGPNQPGAGAGGAGAGGAGGLGGARNGPGRAGAGPAGGGSPPTVSAQFRKAQATKWLIESGSWLELSGEGDVLEVGWRGNTPVAVDVRPRAHRLDTTDIGAPGKGKVKLAARWQPGELELTREVYGVVLIEHVLPPEDDRMVVIVEIEPLVTGMETMWFRREYTRSLGSAPPPPSPDGAPPPDGTPPSP